MHWIQIDDEVLALLESHARPFVDTENDVLRRLLFVADTESVSGAIPSRAVRTPAVALEVEESGPAHPTTEEPEISARALVAQRGTPQRKEGDLRLLLKAHLVKAGDLLVHEQPRKGRTHLATVLSDGWIETEDGQSHATPSGALRSRLGHEINGWECWRHDPSQRKLAELRDELAMRKL